MSKDGTVRAICVAGFVVGPGERVAIGEELELSANDFRTLEYRGRVRAAPEKKKVARAKKEKAE